MPTHARIKGKTGEYKVLRFYTIDDYSCYLLQEHYKVKNNVAPYVHNLTWDIWYPEDRLVLITKPEAKEVFA